MDYEQKYKEALKVMESLYNIVRYQSSSDALLTSQTIEKAFPELRESEDERIRKEIIQFLQLPHPQFVGKRNYEEWIAWLEKQGEQNKTIKPQTHWKPSEEQMQALIKRTQGLHTNSETRKVLESLIFDLQEKL